MKKYMPIQPGRITVHPDREGKSIEEQMREAQSSGEPIKATANINYTERGDGVLPQYDIRTDRFELARMATDKVNATTYATRMQQDGYSQDENGKWIKKPLAPEGGEA